MNNIKENIYCDLLNETNIINAYKIQDSFKYNSKDLEDLNFLKLICVKELELIRYSNNNDDLFNNQFLQIARDHIILPNKITLALITEHEIKKISKIRSYKGILDKELKEKTISFIEEEIFINDQDSIIGNLLLVNSENLINIIEDYFGDSNNCCFLVFDNDFNYRKDFLKKILKDYMIHSQTSTINYFSLSKILTPESQIIRIGGDGFDKVSLQLFLLNENK